MTAALDRLTSEVSEQTTVIDSAITLLNSLAQQIRKNVGNDDALNALADDLDTKTNRLAEAVASNTPETETPVEPTPQEPDAPQA